MLYSLKKEPLLTQPAQHSTILDSFKKDTQSFNIRGSIRDSKFYSKDTESFLLEDPKRRKGL